MGKGKLVGIIAVVVCVIAIIVVVTTRLPSPDGGSDDRIPQGGSEGKIAFMQTDGIHLINPDGTDEITLGEGNWPVWSPNGKKIAYGVDGELCVINDDGTGKTTVRSFEDGSPIPHYWLDDGRIVLDLGTDVRYWHNWPGEYSNRSSIYTMSSDGGDLVKLGDMPVDGRCCTLSLDGKGVVYIGDKPDERHHYYLWVVKTDGSGKRKLVEEDLYTTWGNLCDHMGRGLSWSPDGEKMTFLQYSGGGGHPAGLWLIDADGTSKVLLGGECSVAGWSPDSEKLAMYVYQSGLFIINLDSMSRTKVSGHTDGHPVSWSPNGKRIVFSTSDGSMVVANTDGSGSTVIGYGYWPQWSPD